MPAAGSSNAFGISNNIQYQNSEESSVPELGVDNTEVLDMMVVELPQVSGQTWDLQSFMLGWANENGLSQSDVSMFIGGKTLGSNYDFRNVCFGTGHIPLDVGREHDLGHCSHSVSRPSPM